MNNRNVSTHCNNCGKQGHSFHNCKLPITSYGIILFTYTPEGVKFLMIRRKDSFGYIDFIRGKYSPYNIEQLQNTVNEMSCNEKERIMTNTFDVLWRHMWGTVSTNQFRSEECISQKKFELITDGIVVHGNKVNLKQLVENSNTNWKETEWEFPKGRRNNTERDIDCAIREFQEETGYSKDDIQIIENILPFEEIFVGSNYRSYKHKYFLAYMDTHNDINTMENFQRSEVSKLEWKTFNECIESIRPYNLEKRKILTNIYNLLQQYRLYL